MDVSTYGPLHARSNFQQTVNYPLKPDDSPLDTADVLDVFHQEVTTAKSYIAGDNGATDLDPKFGEVISRREYWDNQLPADLKGGGQPKKGEKNVKITVATHVSYNPANNNPIALQSDSSNGAISTRVKFDENGVPSSVIERRQLADGTTEELNIQYDASKGTIQYKESATH